MWSPRQLVVKQDRCGGSWSLQRHKVFRWIDLFMTEARVLTRDKAALCHQEWVFDHNALFIPTVDVQVPKQTWKKLDGLLLSYPLWRISFPTCCRMILYCSDRMRWDDWGEIGLVLRVKNQELLIVWCEFLLQPVKCLKVNSGRSSLAIRQFLKRYSLCMFHSLVYCSKYMGMNIFGTSDWCTVNTLFSVTYPILSTFFLK